MWIFGFIWIMYCFAMDTFADCCLFLHRRLVTMGEADAAAEIFQDEQFLIEEEVSIRR